MGQLLPIGYRADPITDTWKRGLIATALENNLRPLCWHFGQDRDAATVTGYVTVTLLHEATSIRSAWAHHLGLTGDAAHGYTGHSAGLTISLPNAIDPDEHCRICAQAFDPRDTSPTGRARYNGGEICRSCASL